MLFYKLLAASFLMFHFFAYSSGEPLTCEQSKRRLKENTIAVKHFANAVKCCRQRAEVGEDRDSCCQPKELCDKDKRDWLMNQLMASRHAARYYGEQVRKNCR